MADFPLMPLGGMDTVSEDAALLTGGDSPRHHLRDAVNVNITPTGKATLAPAAIKVCDVAYRDVWQSPLHGDVFARLGKDWVMVNPSDWSCRVLAEVGNGQIRHALVNNLVCVATSTGIWRYDGEQAQRIAIDTPPAPEVMSTAQGTLPFGRYGVAVSWVRQGVESGLSAMALTEQAMPLEIGQRGGGMSVAIKLPVCLDDRVDTVRVYVTTASGTILQHWADFAVGTGAVSLDGVQKLGREAPFAHRSPMVSGRWLCHWQGRLVVARANMLMCSDPMAHHVTDDRYNFLQLPERITFVVPVEGGLWVGQVTHVVFLQGRSWDALVVQRRDVSAPVADSAMLLPADLAGQAGAGGLACALWLSQTGHVLGTADGQAFAMQPGRLDGITGTAVGSVVFDRRVMTAVV